jgi:hypothetical protein
VLQMTMIQGLGWAADPANAGATRTALAACFYNVTGQ